MSGIYIHIPFCKQACSYCDFHFSTNQRLRKPLVNAICSEIEMRKSDIEWQPTTLYFGGGSPSILEENELRQIFDALHESFDLTLLKEVTLESNPDDHTSEKLKLWKNFGINRLSIGIQSFIDRDLELMNRAHNAQHADACVQAARAAGFDALTIDLIYGIPGQSLKEWQSNVQKAIQLNPDHISAYCLTVEEKTLLDHQIKKGIVSEKDDEDIEREYLFLHHKLADCGFDHYEISNFGKNGKQALHNSNYWNGQPYLGFGPSAHSFDGKNVRRWNVASNPEYIKRVTEKQFHFESETLSQTERINEKLMTGLRSKQGFSFGNLDSKVQSDLKTSIQNLVAKHEYLIAFNDTQVRINPEYWLMTDFVLKELFLEP